MTIFFIDLATAESRIKRSATTGLPLKFFSDPRLWSNFFWLVLPSLSQVLELRGLVGQCFPLPQSPRMFFLGIRNFFLVQMLDGEHFFRKITLD